MMLANNAEALALAMLDAGRSTQFVLMTLSGYYGETGREVVLGLLEEQEHDR